jgi:serine/threonine-protein kinase
MPDTPPNTEDLGATGAYAEPPAAEPSAAAGAGQSTQKVATLKDYRLLKKLGEGGMGTVYKAHQISLDRPVALKVPFKHLIKEEAFLGRFYREARLMAKLDHPNILRCFGVGEEGGWHYLTMEFIDGVSMQEWLKVLGKLSIGDALHVTITCARALQHAHEQGLVHRDIKPDNILVTSKGVIKVADLGLAKALTDDLQLSRTGTGAGTPHYMAPEQARDAKHVDGRSDIYALGSMLYTFLTGKTPFQGETYIELLLNKEKGKFAPVRKLNADVPERLDLMIDKAIALKPEHRYQTCADLIKDLESLGLAHTALSFIEAGPAGGVGTVATGAAPSSSASATQPTVVAPPKTQGKGPPPSTVVSPLARTTVSPTDFWFLATKTASGKTLKRKLTTAQILELIKDKSFDLSAQASRTLKGDYRDLASFREFEPSLRARLLRAKTDRKTQKFHEMYETILQEEKAYNRWRWFQNLYLNFTSWVTFVIWIATLAGVGFVIYFVAKLLIRYLTEKVESLG